MKSARQSAGGTANHLAQRDNTNASRNLYPFPAQSLRSDPSDERLRERAALSFVTVFLSVCFLIPMVCAGVMLHFR